MVRKHGLLIDFVEELHKLREAMRRPLGAQANAKSRPYWAAREGFSSAGP
jgi:hypothetical protein